MVNKNRFLVTTVLLFGFLMSSGFSKEFRKTITKTIPLEAGATIEVQTLNGNIRVEGWDKDEVALTADISVKSTSKERGEKALNKIKVDIEKNGKNLSVAARFSQHKKTGFWDRIFSSHTSGSVSFYLKVPRKSNLKALSTNGKINAEDIEGSIRLKTTNGSVSGELLNGSVDARTTNGSIKIKLAGLAEQEDLNFRTTNGSITVYIPSDARRDIHAETVNGTIDTDFPLTIQGRYKNKSLDGKINGGGASLYLQTVNGNIRVREASGEDGEVLKGNSGFENPIRSFAERYWSVMNVSTDSLKQIFSQMLINIVRKSFLR